MKNLKSAILIYGQNKVPMPFSYYKKYDIGTGYVALYEKTEKCCVLCRVLDIREISSFTYHRLILNKNEHNKNEHKELSVIIINSNLKSIEDADEIVNNYNKSFFRTC